MVRSRYQLRTLVFRLFKASTARGPNVTGARPGGAAQALLGAGVDRVDFPSVGLDRNTAERRDAVQCEERAGVVGDPGDFFDRLPCTCRGLGVNDADDLGPDAMDGRLDLIGVEHLAVRPFDHRDLAPARSATSFIRAPKTPLMQTSILSPGSIRLTTKVSMPAEPVPEIARSGGSWSERHSGGGPESHP